VRTSSRIKKLFDLIDVHPRRNQVRHISPAP
jgi:hypothetical protein